MLVAGCRNSYMLQDDRLFVIMCDGCKNESKLGFQLKPYCIIGSKTIFQLIIQQKQNSQKISNMSVALGVQILVDNPGLLL